MTSSVQFSLGGFSLVVGWLGFMVALVGGLWGAISGDRRIAASARHALFSGTIISALSLVCLGIAFLHHDYRYIYVWQNSNNEMASMYLVSAIWGGMDGSLLLWSVLMACYGTVAVWRVGPAIHERLLSWVIPVLGAANGFFLGLVVFLCNPFRLVPPGAGIQDGNGLNPLLQNPSMLIHPPCLYLGFTGFVVPFAFCIAALCSGQVGDQWIQLTRRWTLLAWMFLTCGIILGGNWAYIELGWGGFWAWDPVENASFFPWLAATAFIHSNMVQETRGMLKVWNVCLAVLSYFLAVFGTFLTRSGIVQSVHAFAETDFGWVFLVYLGAMIVLTLGLVIWRWSDLKPEAKMESMLSRELAFLLNNLLLLAICFATIWGVLFPVISEAVTGSKSVVGPPFFDKVNVPLFLALLFLMGIGPMLAWRRTSAKTAWRLAAWPFAWGSAVFVLGLWIDSERRLLPALGFGLSVFAAATVLAELHRAARVRRSLLQRDTNSGKTPESYAVSLVSVVKRRPRRYGGYLVHLGVAISAIAITASMAYKIEKDFTLKQGDTYTVGRYGLQLAEMQGGNTENYEFLKARIIVLDKDSGQKLGELNPERRYYRKKEEATSEVDIRMTPREDLYIALAGLDLQPNQPVPKDANSIAGVFKVFVNPLQVWLWFGGIVMLFGSLLVIGPGLRRVTVTEPAVQYSTSQQAAS